MADYFTNFSVIMSLPTEEAVNYALGLTQQAARIQQGDEIPADFPSSLRDVIEDWQFETDRNDSSQGCGIWLHATNGGVDAACALIQHLLQRYAPDDVVGMEWSNDCSKPRLDAFGGGAAIITAKTIKSLSTGQWLHGRMARIAANKARR